MIHTAHPLIHTSRPQQIQCLSRIFYLLFPATPVKQAVESEAPGHRCTEFSVASSGGPESKAVRVLMITRAIVVGLVRNSLD
jgi:hypothetical protein